MIVYRYYLVFSHIEPVFAVPHFNDITLNVPKEIEDCYNTLDNTTLKAYQDKREHIEK